MSAARTLVKWVLEHDAVLQAHVGWVIDEMSGVRIPKVFEFPAKSTPADRHIEPPYIVWQVIPGATVDGHYGDNDALKDVPIQINTWGKNKDQSWRLAYLVSGALEDPYNLQQANVEISPFHLVRILPDGDGVPLFDQDTSWFQVAAIYNVGVGR